MRGQSPDESRSVEYCDTEVFRPECGEGEAILLRTARYGRMRLGRCVETDMGYLGCATDVLRAADRRCSGERLPPMGDGGLWRIKYEVYLIGMI